MRRRQSKQRQVILEELRKIKTHPRGDELYAIVRQRLPNISLGTVYRNLNELEQEGNALEIYCGDFVRYDGNVAPHDHFICRVCRRVWDYDLGRGAVLPPSESQTEDGFHILGQYTMYVGICPDCAS